MTIGRDDTVAAVATAAGTGAIAVVRLSGSGALAIACRVLRRTAESLPERTLVPGRVHDAAGEVVDRVLVVAMRGPRSYTGEDLVEVHGHGGLVNVGRILRALVDAGARPAEPGELTRRAFANGKIDLVRAEAVAEVIVARSERAARVAQRHLAGEMGAAVRGWRARLVGALADLEAELEFPEEGQAFPPLGETLRRLEEVRAAAREAATERLGSVLRDGLQVVLAGRSNVGKSSIFNSLLGEERAVVAAEAGTTRDYVDARIEWDGVAVVLTDTAGERGADSEAERRGIDLGKRRASLADVVVEVHSVDAVEVAAATLGEDSRAVRVMNKVDLRPDAVVPEGWVGTSAVTGHGIAALRAAILRAAGVSAAADDEGLVVTSQRQRDLLEAVVRHLDGAFAAERARQPLELVTLEVRAAGSALGQLMGDDLSPDVLDAVFARFCIGK